MTVLYSSCRQQLRWVRPCGFARAGTKGTRGSQERARAVSDQSSHPTDFLPLPGSRSALGAVSPAEAWFFFPQQHCLSLGTSTAPFPPKPCKPPLLQGGVLHLHTEHNKQGTLCGSCHNRPHLPKNYLPGRQKYLRGARVADSISQDLGRKHHLTRKQGSEGGLSPRQCVPASHLLIQPLGAARAKPASPGMC